VAVLDFKVDLRQATTQEQIAVVAAVEHTIQMHTEVATAVPVLS
jgi:hypothetical protein